MADRYTYLPLVGPCLLAFHLPNVIAPRSRRALALSAAAILALLAVVAWRQVAFWLDSRTIWTRTLQFTTDNWLAHNNLGAALVDLGQTDAAAKEYDAAIHLNPLCFKAHNNLGELCINLGKTDEAIGHFNDALKIQPGQAGILDNLATALYQKGQFAAAIMRWQDALSAQPDDFVALNALAWVKATCPDASQRDGPEAVRLAERAVDLSAGRDPEVLSTLAAAYAEANRFPDAVDTLSKAISRAESQKKTDFAAKLGSRLERYKAGKPEYIDAAEH